VGLVIDHFGSHGGFLLKLVIAATTIGVLIAVVPRPKQKPSSLAGIDLPRGVLFAPAIAAVLIAVEKGRSWGWNDPRVIGGLAGGMLLLAYWVWHQARERTPLIDVRMLLDRRIALANVAMICLSLGCIQLGQLFSLIVRQPTWTGAGFALSATALGWFMLSLNSLAMFVSPLAGVLARHYGARRAAVWGSLLSIGAWLLLAASHATLVQTLTAAALIMIGLCLLFPSVYMIVVECVGTSRTSEATGMASVSQAAFMAVGAQVLFGILATHTVSETVSNGTHPASVFPTDTAYTLAFTYVAIMCVLGLISVMALRPATAITKATAV
jgi:MFS family permease